METSTDLGLDLVKDFLLSNNIVDYKAINKKKSKEKIYLACAYSYKHPNEEVVKGVLKERYEKITKIALQLIEEGYIVYSPITHSHPIAQNASLEIIQSYDIWLEQDEAFMDWADRMVIAIFKEDPDPLHWYDSYGVNYEQEYMDTKGKEIICREF